MLGKSATETLKMLHEAFGMCSLSGKAVCERHSRVKAGRVEEDERSGLPSTSKTTENVGKILELIHEDRRGTIRELKNGVFWNATPCGSCKNRRFGGT
jgi:hypothetical protein